VSFDEIEDLDFILEAGGETEYKIDANIALKQPRDRDIDRLYRYRLVRSLAALVLYTLVRPLAWQKPMASIA